VVLIACGSKASGSKQPTPVESAATKRVELNADHKRSTPLTTGEHADAETAAEKRGCHVMMTADQHIESMKCRLEGANYTITFEQPGGEKQTIWCEAAEADVAKCDQLAFDKIFDPKP
jgi:hypothetical protein